MPQATKVEVCAAIRELADWVEKHGLSGGDICSLSVCGWGQKEAHITPAAFFALVPDCHGHGGHFTGVVDGMRVVSCILPKLGDGKPLET